MRRFILFIASAVLMTTVLHAEKYKYADNDEGGMEIVNIQSQKTNGDCIASEANFELDINNIRANLLGAGDFWWDGNADAQYEFPKGSGNFTLYSGALWFTGMDDANQLRCSGQTYRNQGHDFWTGPLNQFGQVEAATCAAFDQFWEVLGDDISTFQADFQAAGGVTISSASIPEGVLKWPGRGNPYYAGTELFFDGGSLAPFYDFDGNGIYDPTKGDFPTIKSTIQEYADQMVFWVSNDEGNVHSRTTGVAIGVQVNSLAFAYQTSDALNNMTFYTYEIIKKSAGALSETYMGIFVDPDNGEATDDFIGCDTVRSIGYVYNASTPDAQYGFNIPITAIDFFEGPLADDGSELGLSSFVYFNNSTGPQSDPDNAGEFRNYQTGFWKDGTQITEGGTHFGGTVPTNYVYPDNPAISGLQHECEVSGAGNGGDRRFVQNSGPFTLTGGQAQRITIGVISVMYENYQPCTDSYTSKIIPADEIAQALFDNDFGLIDGPDAPTLRLREMSNEIIITLVNEPSSNNYAESYSDQAVGAPSGTDSLYKFEGYIVYQLANDQVTAQDLGNSNLAQPVHKVDIKNGVTSIYNFNFDEANEMYVPELKIEGTDNGITRSVKITNDKFTGEPLINHRTYYFAAIAYAHNEYLPFSFPFPGGIQPQLNPYLQGRGNFKKYTAIPHDITTTNGGTVLNAEFGESVSVRRLEGQGNGGNEIELSADAEEALLQNALGYLDIVEYAIGKDPIGLKIVDPVELKNVDFELLIKSYELTQLISGIDTTYEYLPVTYLSDSTVWELHVFENGVLLEVINSDRTIDKPYDQYIDGYGITVNVGIPSPISTNEVTGNDIYDVLSSSIVFTDPTNEWLAFIGDASSSNQASDWIRGGELIIPDPANVYDSYQYTSGNFYDPNSVFEDMVSGNFAPYCLAANYADNNATSPAPRFAYGPGFKHDFYNPVGTVTPNINTLDRLHSVDIVLTSDKTKWSRTVVFETGEDETLTIGGARKGDLRKSNSIDINGFTLAGTEGMSYFPGYAINKETGERLIVAFGESSERIDNNGGDMIFNPTAKAYDALGAQDPVFGGKHFIYVIDRAYNDANVDAIFNTFDAANFTLNNIDPAVAAVYEDIMYTAIPMLDANAELLPVSEGLIPTDVRISLNVEATYDTYSTSESFAANNNNTMPRYGFSTVGLAPLENVEDVAKDALDDIRVVPNPYYGYSSYERDPLDNFVKITNLPNKCTVGIYTLDGKLVRQFDRAVGDAASTNAARQEISAGQVFNENNKDFNLDNSITWDLKNHKDIMVGSGSYIIHISAPGIGEQVVKAAVFLRPSDVNNF